MNALEETKKKRFQYLNKLYDITGGSSQNFVSMWHVGQELGFDRDETANIEAQIDSSRPKHGILTESLRSLRTVLEGAAGSLVASGLLPQLSQVIHLLSQ